MIVILVRNHRAATDWTRIVTVGSHGHTPCNILLNKSHHRDSLGRKALGLHACKRNTLVFLRYVPSLSPQDSTPQTLNQCQHSLTWLQDLLFKTVSVSKFPLGFAFNYSVLSNEATMTVYSFVTYDAHTHDTPPLKEHGGKSWNQTPKPWPASALPSPI